MENNFFTIRERDSEILLHTLVDTHCHINLMLKKEFDIPIVENQLPYAQRIIEQAGQCQVNRIVNVGTSLVESQNCVKLAQNFSKVYAAIGIHPNDLNGFWKQELDELERLLKAKNANKIVAVGEIGFDKHYPGFNIQRQHGAFCKQVDMALEYNVPIIIHTRQAPDETVNALERYTNETNLRGVIHCFSEDQTFADYIVNRGFMIGIGGTLTYPKNDMLRVIARNVPLDSIVLETDAPFLPPQSIRGQQNHPKYILTIAEFLANLQKRSLAEIAEQTTANACKLFNFAQYE